MNQLLKKMSLVGILFFQPIMSYQIPGIDLDLELPRDPKITSSTKDFKFSDVSNPVLAIGVIGAAVYVVQTYLVQENYKVGAKYPHAQAWYDAMAEKYPAAHLGEKLFLQKMFAIPAKFISWCSDFNYIYFRENELIRINSLYGMLQNNQVISDIDQEFLSAQEFILLHEAGHIEHKDIKNRFLAQAALCGVLGGVVANKKTKYAYQDYKSAKGEVEKNCVKVDFDIKVNSMTVDHKPIIIGAASTFILKFLLNRYHERNADEFAYTLCDDKALAGAIAFFESEKMDPILHLARAEYSPFIQTDSIVGNVAQSVASCVTGPLFYLGKTVAQIINSSDFIRWLYDLHHLNHPGSPARVALMRAEQKRRAQLSK